MYSTPVFSSTVVVALIALQSQLQSPLCHPFGGSCCLRLLGLPTKTCWPPARLLWLFYGTSTSFQFHVQLNIEQFSVHQLRRQKSDVRVFHSKVGIQQLDFFISCIEACHGFRHSVPCGLQVVLQIVNTILMCSPFTVGREERGH